MQGVIYPSGQVGCGLKSILSQLPDEVVHVLRVFLHEAVLPEDLSQELD